MCRGEKGGICEDKLFASIDGKRSCLFEFKHSLRDIMHAQEVGRLENYSARLEELILKIQQQLHQESVDGLNRHLRQLDNLARRPLHRNKISNLALRSYVRSWLGWSKSRSLLTITKSHQIDFVLKVY